MNNITSFPRGSIAATEALDTPETDEDLRRRLRYLGVPVERLDGARGRALDDLAVSIGVHRRTQS